MSIRGRLRALALGAVIPLVLLGLAMLFLASDDAKWIPDTGLGWRAGFARIGFSSVIIYPGPNTGWR